jgi:hypothetical protein
MAEFNDPNQNNSMNNMNYSNLTQSTICLDNFIKSIQQELTVACMIDMSIPKKQIIQIIDKAKLWFYKNYEYSVEERLYLIENTAWTSTQFLSNPVITLPSDVYSVFGIYETGKGYGGGRSLGTGGDTDFSVQRALLNNAYDKNAGMVGIASENLMYYVVNSSFYDMVNQLLIYPISFHYNNLTNKLAFTGHLPDTTLILKVYRKIDDCALFKDDYFFRWVAAQCKIQLSRVLGFYDYSLPGNIRINFDDIKTEGQDELAELKEIIKSDEGTDWFFTSGMGF